MEWLIHVGSGLFTFLLSSFLAYRLLWQNRRVRRDRACIAFLHPNRYEIPPTGDDGPRLRIISDPRLCLSSDARGGGERVLWMAIQYVQKAFPNATVAVYTARGGAADSVIIQNAEVFSQYSPLAAKLGAPEQSPDIFAKNRKCSASVWSAPFDLSAYGRLHCPRQNTIQD